jgi:hypothetical protein
VHAPDRRLIAVNFAACMLLLVQYLLGMITNLFVTLPAHHPGARSGNYFGGVVSGIGWLIPHGPAWAAAHAAFGLALVAAAIGSLVMSRWHRSRAVTTLSVLGALAIIGAGFNGASFLNYGENFSSMIMAGLWALALGCYLTSMFLTARSSWFAPEAAPAEEVAQGGTD